MRKVKILMKKNISSIIASILSFCSLIIGAIFLIPQFNKPGISDQSWVYFVITAFPLMTFIYAIAGTNEEAKSVAPNAFGLMLSIPAIIASIYLGIWAEAVCLLIVTILLIKQLLIDLNEKYNSK